MDFNWLEKSSLQVDKQSDNPMSKHVSKLEKWITIMPLTTFSTYTVFRLQRTCFLTFLCFGKNLFKYSCTWEMKTKMM